MDVTKVQKTKDWAEETALALEEGATKVEAGHCQRQIEGWNCSDVPHCRAVSDSENQALRKVYLRVVNGCFHLFNLALLIQ